MGLDTRLGEQGLSLSGGQRQRLALARAILVRPRVLVLDDTLSALDIHTEAEVEEALKSTLVGVTGIVVAHRASTVLLADRVAVLVEGRIAHVGTHHELLAGYPSTASCWRPTTRSRWRRAGEHRTGTGPGGPHRGVAWRQTGHRRGARRGRRVPRPVAPPARHPGRSHRRWLLVLIGVVVVEAAARLFIPVLVQRVLDDGLGGDTAVLWTSLGPDGTGHPRPVGVARHVPAPHGPHRQRHPAGPAPQAVQPLPAARHRIPRPLHLRPRRLPHDQ
ncbi:ATP-binding cassette domain-containing protein [Tessaracoccus coleopterorum]|uniref:ATP-binding cassette domain-containing protein n=1 Tax=Tessaracoccus coleopterorum TaxID=2714950 RepID=UPI002F91A35C